MLRDLRRDAIEFARVSAKGDVSWRTVLHHALVYDPFAVLALNIAARTIGSRSQSK